MPHLQNALRSFLLPISCFTALACAGDSYEKDLESCDSCDESVATGRLHGTVLCDSNEVLPEGASLQLYQLIDSETETDESLREVVVVADVQIDGNGRYGSPSDLAAVPTYARVWVGDDWYEWTSGQPSERLELLVFPGDSARYDLIVGEDSEGARTVDVR